LSKLHLKVQPLLKNTPKYRQQSTQLMAPPEAVVSAAQCVLYLRPNRMHCDLFALMNMSTSFKYDVLMDAIFDFQHAQYAQ